MFVVSFSDSLFLRCQIVISRTEIGNAEVEYIESENLNELEDIDECLKSIFSILFRKADCTNLRILVIVIRFTNHMSFPLILPHFLIMNSLFYTRKKNATNIDLEGKML